MDSTRSQWKQKKMEPRAQVELALGRERDAKMCINVSVYAGYVEVDRCSALLLLFTHEVGV